MTARAYTRATRLAAAFLARLTGTESAASAMKIDPRTVRSWQETIEVPADEWEAIQAVLLARAGEMAATGKATGLVAALTGAGIAARNVRYATLIARREARREVEEQPPEPNPIRDAIDRLDDRRKRLLRDFIIAETRERAYRPPSDDRVGLGPPLDVVAFIDGLGALSDSEFEAEAAAVKAKLAEIDERYRAELSPASPQSSAVAEVAPEPAVTPTPISRRATRGQEPLPMLIDTGRMGGGRDGSGDGPWYDADSGERRRPRW
jgi:hypothetical protein